jgi:hypothetical protein
MIPVWILTFDRPQALNRLINKLGQQGFTCNVFSNHPVVRIRAENEPYLGEVIVNTLNSPESNSWCARSWNTIMQKGFPKSDRLILLQDDTDVGPGFGQWIEECSQTYDFIWGPAGDQFHYLTLDVLRATGWWDERFIGCYCGDFDFLKRVYMAYDHARISIDENHPGTTLYVNPCGVAQHINIRAKAIDSTYVNQHNEVINQGCWTIRDSEAFYEAKWGAPLPNCGSPVIACDKRIEEID